MPGTSSSEGPSRWQRTPPSRPSGPAAGRPRSRPPPWRLRAHEVPAAGGTEPLGTGRRGVCPVLALIQTSALPVRFVIARAE
eukprot:936525-Pyramimonas_sp.AAC.1